MNGNGMPVRCPSTCRCDPRDMIRAMTPMAVQKRAMRLRRKRMPATTSASRRGIPIYEPFSIGESKTMFQFASREATSESPSAA